jgi:dTDP-4-amino-4,6-dideoxygalactose transaminase
VRLNVPLTGAEELAAVAEVLASGYLTQGPVTARFERAVADRCGTAHAFATSSCTTALHLTMAGLGIGPGDEVVVPDFTFPATINAVVQTGATPVIAEIDPVTFNLDAQRLPEVLSARTRAVIAVHTFGQCAEMDAINEAAAGTTVLEDAACAIGGTYRGRPVGSLGRAAAFSFHPRKIITTGEGGMVTTDDAELADRIAVLRTHGGVRRELYLEFVDAGYNYRMSDINAAIGLAQCARLDGIVARRQELAAHYARLLAAVPGAAAPDNPVHIGHTYQSYVVLLAEGVDRDDVIRGMRDRGVETTIGTYSLQRQPAYRRFVRRNWPVAAAVFDRTLTLPLFPQMVDGDQELVVAALAETLRAGR